MKDKRLTTRAIFLLLFFALQFIVGMTVNLFMKLPVSHPGTTGNEYFSRSGHSLIWTLSGGGGTALTIHVYLAIGLVVGCLALVIESLQIGNKLWSWVSISAALFTIGSLFNGLSFVNYNRDVSSMIMAICWLIAVAVLIFGLLKSSHYAGAKSPKT